MRRTRILLVVLAVVSLAALFTTRVSRKMPDFEVYWTAGSRAIAAQPLYRPEDGHFQFKYLPAFALLASPLAMMPLAAAKAAWFALSAVLMLVLLWLSLRALPAIHRPPALLVAATFVAMAKFYAHELVLGQVNLLFGVLAVLAIVWME
ncbi:MAG TPA: glycosyltransferase 87 family protein, partial [Vicinamibacterales bacterium]